MTDERTNAIFDALRLGMTRRAAASLCGIHPATFYRMLEADATFREGVEKAEGEAEARYTALVARAAEDPKTWTAAAWWLERRRHADFAQHQRVDMTVDVRREAERLAGEFGLDADEIMAEAEAVLRGG
jgi:hypothetical protein